ncbi:hypothetical protein C4J81_02025 [Deltaproteobacteria bacterium Smac51]|nr:hypothetical protein C4J81_02025 [Deltaproteobacteria bacterium Smac51]
MLEDNGLSPAQRQRKNKLERWAIVLIAAALLVLTLVQREVISLGPGFSDSQGLVALVSINVSVLLTTILLVLILRSLYRIFFEKHGWGSLQTKMVMSFISLSLLPTLLIFYYSYRVIISGHDLWFSPQIEEALGDSINLSEAALTMDNSLLTAYGIDILDELEARRYNSSNRSALATAALGDFLEWSRRRYHLTSVEFYGPEGQLISRGGDANLPPIYHSWFAGLEGTPLPWINTVETDTGDLTRLAWPVRFSESGREVEFLGYLVIGRQTLAPIRSQIEDVRHALVGYSDALKVQRPFRVTQLTALTAMTMLAVFISMWIGSHLARSLARPVTDLVEGTRKVAAGDWDYVLNSPGGSSEFADLVKAFNRMTGDLKELYVELDARRRFVESVLKNVSTGVVILSTDGAVIHANQAASRILDGKGQDDDSEAEASPSADGVEFYVEAQPELPPPLAALVEEVVTSRHPARRVVERHIRLNIDDAFISLKTGLAPLRNEEGDRVGYLMTFDDLTELERAQRLAAWREVARRIAHEVKNPLTPIQLSAQRLRRRFSERLAGESDAAIFEECTDVIIRQVEEMKELVDEFSQFARLPEIKPRPGDFTAFLEDSLVLFRQAHKKVNFILTIKNRPPEFSFDPEQMRRVLTNILDNAVAAMNGEGEVHLNLEVDELTGLKLTIQDTGPGLDPQVKDRLFDPHVTTKEHGQGLGLAIVRTIVSDHGGFVRALSRPGEGAAFVIELPLRS